MPTANSNSRKTKSSSSKKRTGPAAVTAAAAKRPRADVHPLQEELAKRAAALKPGEPLDELIIAATMGTGKPRIGGKLLDLVVPGLVEECEEDVPDVLAVVVVTDAKHGREQAAQYGTDFPGPYHDSELGAVLRLLKGEGHAARIMIPFVSFRKMCYKPKGGTRPMWNLLEKLGQPEVVFLIDEVTEVYKPANGRLPAAIHALRTKYEKVTDATIRVVGMSGTPELENEAYAKRAKALFGGVAPTLVEFTKEEEAELLDDIDPQRKVSTREQGVVETLPAPTEPAEQLDQLSALVVGNKLSSALSLGDAAVKKLAGEVLVQQVLGDDQDGGVLFQKCAPGGKAPMFTVNKDGAIGKKPLEKFEAVVVAVDSPYGTQALYDALAELQVRSGTDGELRAFTVHDLRLEAQIQATKGADKVPHAYLKRDVADQKAALKAFLADAAAQKGTAFAIIDKAQALSGTNDFAKGVPRAIAIGAWEPHELDQFYKRLGRAAPLAPGDLVPKTFHGVYLASPFAANLTAKPSERRVVPNKEALSDEAKAQLGKLEAAAGTTVEDKAAYRKIEDVATMLGATELPDDPALTYLKCVGDEMEKETWLEAEYKPLVEHDEGCKREELDEVDETTGEKKTKVVACCDACKCIFAKAAADDDDDDEADA